MDPDVPFSSPLQTSSWGMDDPSTPRFRTPMSTPDRFISDHRSQDNVMSHFFLTTKENVVPLQASPDRWSRSPALPSSSRGTARGSTTKSRKSTMECSPPRPPALGTEPYTSKLARTLFPDTQSTVLAIHSQVLHQQNPSLTEQTRYRNSLGVVFEENRARNFRSRNFRVIARAPERILDAADMIDDFYLHLIDWSSKDVLAVGLQGTVYLWDAKTCNITQLPCQRPPNGIVCGVSWCEDGRHLSLGTDDGSVEIWDVETQTITRRLYHHEDRVGALSWNGFTLASGSKDATIRISDLRDPLGSHTLRSHQQGVCGLRWSPDRVRLASGGNDNQLLLWDSRTLSTSTQPFMRLNKHTAAIKAIAWNPVQHNLLASGGGSEDKILRFWNTSTGECLHHLNTESQVCGVLWNLSGTELVSSHGFSHNRLTIWKYPTLRRVADLTGHTSRVLHLCMSADGEVVVSAAGDETIRFWRCFPPREEFEGRSRGVPIRRDSDSRRCRSQDVTPTDTALRDELALR